MNDQPAFVGHNATSSYLLKIRVERDKLIGRREEKIEFRIIHEQRKTKTAGKANLSLKSSSISQLHHNSLHLKMKHEVTKCQKHKKQ